MTPKAEQLTETGERKKVSPAHARRQVVSLVARHALSDSLRGVTTTEEFYTPGVRVTGETVLIDSAAALAQEKEHENPFGTVMLRMYDSEDTSHFENLVSEYIGEKDLHALRSLTNRDISNDTPPATSEITRLKRRINRKVYGKIRDGLGLANLRVAEEKFKEMQGYANDAVTEHAEKLYEGDFTAKLKNEVLLGLDPAELFTAFVDQETDPRLKFELQRQFNNIVISLQIERNLPPNGESKLPQIQNMLNHEFYDTPGGKTEDRVIYGLYHEGRGDFIGEPIFGTENMPPSEPPPARCHYKRFILPVRKLQTGEEVFTHPDIKKRSTAINKALRKARENDAKGKGDIIDVDTEVRDSHRMKIVILGNQQQTDAVRDSVFDLITNQDNFHYFYDDERLAQLGSQTRNGHPDGGGEIKDSTGGHPGQSDEVSIFRMLIEFEGIRTPAEIGFQSLLNYMRDEVSVGTFDRRTRAFRGPAHGTYAIQREVPITDILFPPEIYTELVRPDSYYVKRLPPALEKKARELRNKYKYSGPFNVFES